MPGGSPREIITRPNEPVLNLNPPRRLRSKQAISAKLTAAAPTETPVTPEIRAFEFALGLFSVLIGLSIADVATSLHRLIRKHDLVRWDPLALLAALFALLMAIGMWFDLWGIRNATSVRHFFLYLALVASFFVLFLLAAASLPDEVSGAGRSAQLLRAKPALLLVAGMHFSNHLRSTRGSLPCAGRKAPSS